MTTDTTEGLDMKKSTASRQDVHSRITVAQFISKNLDKMQAKGVTQKQIAEKLGYKMPNMISMLRRDEVKIPIPKVPALARALEVDPAFLFRLVMMQHWPEELEAVRDIFGSVVTKNETALLDVWRRVTKDADPEPPRGIVKALSEVTA